MRGSPGTRENIARSLSGAVDAILQRGAAPDDAELVRRFRARCKPMDATHVGCVFFHKSTVLAVNEAWSEIWEYSEEEVKGRTLALLQGPKSRTPELTVFEHTMLHRLRPCEVALINYTKSGCPLPCVVHAFPIGKDHYVSFMICDVADKDQQYVFSDVQEFVANLSSAKTFQTDNNLYTSDRCNMSVALYELFWHALFYFTGPLSLIVVIPVCGVGFAKVHGFLWTERPNMFTVLTWLMEHSIFALVLWSTVRFVVMAYAAETAATAAAAGTAAKMASINASFSPSSTPMTSSWENSPQWRCADFELEVGMPIFFIVIRLTVIATKYARMTKKGRDALMHHTQTYDERVAFNRRTLLAMWAGMVFDPWPTKLAIDVEFDRKPHLRELKVVMASALETTQELGIQTEAQTGQHDVSFENPLAAVRTRSETKTERNVELQLSNVSRSASPRKSPPPLGADQLAHTPSLPRTLSQTRTFSEPKKNICAPKCDYSETDTAQYHSVSIVDIVTAICLDTGERSSARKLWGKLLLFVPIAYIIFNVYIHYTSGRLPRQMADQCKDTLVQDEVFLALSLIVGAFLSMSITTFFAVMHIDLHRRHAQMAKIGQAIHYLVLEGPSNALAWLQARRVLVSVGESYLERLAYFMFAVSVFFVYMFIWSIRESARGADVPLPRSYPLLMSFCAFFQLSVLASVREAGLANGCAKKHAKEWCMIRTQLLEELGRLQVQLQKKIEGERHHHHDNDNDNKRLAGHQKIRKRPRRLSSNLNWQNRPLSSPGMTHALKQRRQISSAYYESVDSRRIRVDSDRLKSVELAVSSCIDEMTILNVSFPLSMHKVPLSLALFRALVGLFYTQMYVLLVYTFRVLNSSADLR
jgi:hypothetical protein